MEMVRRARNNKEGCCRIQRKKRCGRLGLNNAAAAAIAADMAGGGGMSRWRWTSREVERVSKVKVKRCKVVWLCSRSMTGLGWVGVWPEGWMPSHPT